VIASFVIDFLRRASQKVPDSLQVFPMGSVEVRFQTVLGRSSAELTVHFRRTRRRAQPHLITVRFKRFFSERRFALMAVHEQWRPSHREINAIRDATSEELQIGETSPLIVCLGERRVAAMRVLKLCSANPARREGH